MDSSEHYRKIYERLQYFHSVNKIPHIIFHGDFGCGKMNILFKFLKMIYNNNENSISSNVMFVNCAHGKGIKFIREDIKCFAKSFASVNNGVNFKSIVLLNAEHLTIDAQSALRRCIEQFSVYTRFFIIIENKTKLMAPIISRFCEIHVPCEYRENRKINIFESELINSFPRMCLEDKEKNNEIGIILNEFFDEEEHNDYKKVYEIVEKLYDNAFCCEDIVKWINSCNIWSNIEKKNINMFYIKVKSEYRCEKLLMMFLLTVTIIDPLIDIKAISFM